jgi:hypothetical protein
MEAIGLDHHTRELAGLARAITANDTTRVIGKENTAAWSTIITGTAATTGITTVEATTGTTIITTTITTTITTMIGNARHRNRVVDLTERVSLATALCIE